MHSKTSSMATLPLTTIKSVLFIKRFTWKPSAMNEQFTSGISPLIFSFWLSLGVSYHGVLARDVAGLNTGSFCELWLVTCGAPVSSSISSTSILNWIGDSRFVTSTENWKLYVVHVLFLELLVCLPYIKISISQKQILTKNRQLDVVLL